MNCLHNCYFNGKDFIYLSHATKALEINFLNISVASHKH